MQLSLTSSLDSKVVKLFLQVVGKEAALKIQENQQELYVRNASPQFEIAGQALSITRYLNFTLNQGSQSSLFSRSNAFENALVLLLLPHFLIIIVLLDSFRSINGFPSPK